MKDEDIDTHLRQHLSGDQPREEFKQEILRDSTAEFVRVRRRRSVWRRAELAAASILIASVAFLGGRLSAPPALPGNVDVMPQAAAKPDGVTVPTDLVAWLDAARLFKRLGMEERMDRAFDKAGKLLPYDAVAASSVTRQATVTIGDDVFENQNKHSILTDIFDSYESVESISGIIAQSFGGNYYESKMD
jgi:hypothetical protein